MNTALVLTGHMRCWRTTLPYLKEEFIDKYNADVFIFTWDDEGYWVSPDRDPMSLGVNPKSPNVDLEELTEAFQPKGISVHSFENYRERFEENAKTFQPFAQEIRPVNIISQFYAIKHGLKMMFDTQKFYSRVIRMRPDLVIHDTLPNFDHNTFYTLAHPNHSGKGTGDMMYVGNAFHMDRMMRISDNLEVYTQRLQRFCPHMFVEECIVENEFPWMEMSLNKTLMHTPNGMYRNFE
jgi:hypothetical protein